MRDIRNDLLERANLTQDRIKAADVHFEGMVAQLRNEHDACGRLEGDPRDAREVDGI